MAFLAKDGKEIENAVLRQWYYLGERGQDVTTTGWAPPPGGRFLFPGSSRRLPAIMISGD
jgi:hypothetical protein